MPNIGDSGCEDSEDEWDFIKVNTKDSSNDNEVTKKYSWLEL